MLGLWGEYAHVYLLVIAATTTLVFALPIFLAPLAWARRFGWKIPTETDLAIYFGRCLGAFILIVECLMLRAGLTGVGMLFTFEVLALVAVLMIAVALTSPRETLEIGMYSGLLVLTLLFWPQ